MTFLLYGKERREGVMHYRQLKTITLAGDGLIYSACKKHLGSNDVGWTITDQDMLTAGGYNPDTHALVIDTAPSRSTVSLFEIKSICGYTYATWTPLMLTFEQLFVDAEPPSTVEALKNEFDDDECERVIVREFLYLMGGYAEGSWNWGGNSRTTAALLWEDAWSYFQQRLLG